MILQKISSNLVKTRKILTSFHRTKTSLGLWEEDLSSEIKKQIEKYWSLEVCCIKEQKDVNCYYALPMFPYPSGNLHMGHVRVYSISDTIARFQTLNGKNVIHPMGWDAFGLPAENAAIEHNIAPSEWTASNIKSMKNQLIDLGFNFDWNREILTCDPQYYKWTQYIFIKLFEKGLAYQNKALVNWDPIDKTVLADEQVDDNGCSWRSGAKVEKRILQQWFLRTTKFAKKLYDGLSNDYLENWNDIINLQQHWIGECNGLVVTFHIQIENEKKYFDVWTSKPYKFIHGKCLLFNGSHILLSDLSNKAKINLEAFNPITKTKLPVYVTNDVNYPEGRDVYIACPQIDTEDYCLGRMFKISSTQSETLNIELENQKAIDIAQNLEGYFVSSKLKDWLISRQRYWGTPIPIIHCVNCGAVPVPDKDLPVMLPESPDQLKSTEWLKCKCPKCNLDGKRETDTMDTFVDSSWYYYRFLDPHNKKMPFEKEKLIGKTPVDIYIGGKEHAVLHLYYARFMSHFLYSLGWTLSEEPFRRLLVQGMVMGQSYKVKSTGKYIPLENVEKVGKEYKEKSSGELVLLQWEKMSKSKHNGESPERLVTTYGCDTTRLLILADVPPATSRNWSEATFPGVLNWQNRLWITIRDFLKYREGGSQRTLSNDEFYKLESKLWEARNYFIATTTFHFKHTHKLSVGISRLQGLTNVLRNKLPVEIIAQSKEYELTLAALLIMLSPVTPHFCSELWAGFQSAPFSITESCRFLDWDKTVLEQKWPQVDDHYQLSFQCKVDGADRSDFRIKATELANLTEEDAIKIMIDQEKVAKRIKRGIIRTKFELYPGCRAILHIFTDKSNKKTEINRF